MAQPLGPRKLHAGQLTVLMSALCVACGSEGPAPQSPDPEVPLPNSLRFLPGSMGLVPDGEAAIVTQFLDETGQVLDGSDRRVSWQSSDTTKVSLTAQEAGVRIRVVGKAEGTAVLTGTAEGAGGSVQVDVAPVAFTSLAAGPLVSCGLNDGGRAFCWGGNLSHVLASPLIEVGSATPYRVEGMPTLQAIIPGANNGCGLTTAGQAYCWGNNDWGQVGNGTVGPVNSGIWEPQLVAGSHVFTSLSVGDNYVCGIDDQAHAFCWGPGGDGALGTGTPDNQSTPTEVAGGLQFAELTTSLGNRHTCARTATGQAYCWGVNSSGQLGDGTTETRFEPTPVAGTLTFTSLSAGLFHTCGIESTGGGYCWGDNRYGQLGKVPDPQVMPIPVAGGIAWRVRERVRLSEH